jgi:putative endonuclease
MFYVYVLRSCKTDRRYVGSCENVDDRLRRHNAGHSKATRMAFHEFCCTVRAFRTAPKPRKERYYKSARGRDELNKLDS